MAKSDDEAFLASLEGGKPAKAAAGGGDDADFLAGLEGGGAKRKPSFHEIRKDAGAPSADEPKPAPRQYPADQVGTLKADLKEAAKPLAEESTKDRAIRGVKAIGHHFAGAGRALGTALLHPIDTATSPARRRETLRGVDDIVTLGYGQKIAAKIGNALGDTEETSLDPREHFTGRLFDSTGPEGPNPQAAADAVKAPGFRALGNTGAMFLPGAGAAIGRGGAKLVARALPGAPAGALSSAALGAGRAVAGHAVTAPVVSGLSAGAEGDRMAAAVDAATDPVGLTLAGTLGGAGAGLANKIGSSRGAQARKFIEDKGAGAKVGVLTPGEGGVFARELAGIPANDKGIGIAARRGAENIVDAITKEAQSETGIPYRAAAKTLKDAATARAPKVDAEAVRLGKEIVAKIEERHDVETTKPYREAKAKIDASDEASNLRDVSPLKQKLTELRYSTKMSPADQATAEGLLKQLDLFTGPDGVTNMTEAALNDYKSMLQRVSKTGSRVGTKSPKEASLAGVASAAKAMVDEGPYARLNELYAKGMKSLGDARESVGLKRKPGLDRAVDEAKIAKALAVIEKRATRAADQEKLAAAKAVAATPRRQLGLPDRVPEDAVKDVKRVKLALMRRGQNTNTAGGDADVDAFIRAHPDLAHSADLSELARARADLSYRLIPHHGGLMTKIAGTSLGPAAAITAAALAHGPLGLLAAPAIVGLQNATPIAGRILAPLAARAGSAAGAGTKIARIVQAAQAGATREEIQAKAAAAGVDAETAERIRRRFGTASGVASDAVGEGPEKLPVGLASKTAIKGDFPGLVEPGNVDLTTRPRVENADGSVSSVRSASFNLGGKEVLLPTVSDDGRILTDDQAIALYRKTGRHLGKFETPDAATAYAQRLHEQQARAGGLEP